MYGSTEGLGRLIISLSLESTAIRLERSRLDLEPSEFRGDAQRALSDRVRGLAAELLAIAENQDGFIAELTQHHTRCVEKRAEIERARIAVLAKQDGARDFLGSYRTVEKLIPASENKSHYSASPRPHPEQTPGYIWVEVKQVPIAPKIGTISPLGAANGTDVLPEQEERARTIRMLQTPTDREDLEWITLLQTMPERNW